MNKLFLSAVLAGIVSLSYSQEVENKKLPTLVVNFILNDFSTAQRLQQASIGDVLKDKNWARFSEMSYGLSLQYMTGITEHIDFSGTFGGSFVKYPFRKKPSPTSDGLLIEADVAVNVKLLPDNYTVVPYATGGVGVSMYRASDFGAYVPLGIGFQVNLGKGEAFVFTQGQYKVAVTQSVSNHFMYSLGFAAPLKL